jgi:hypothetical protein
VSPAEVQATQGLYGGTYLTHEKLIERARKERFAAVSVAGLRAKVTAGEPVDAKLPKPLGKRRDLAKLPRSAFVPLADVLAARLAHARSYDSTYGAEEKIFHVDVTSLWKAYSEHELFAALSILTAREGGVEFALTRSKDGRVHAVQGKPNMVELDSALTGLDLITHTHPRSGADAARPSDGDYLMCRQYDPDHEGHVVSDDGWAADYATPDDGQTAATPKRLWKTQ